MLKQHQKHLRTIGLGSALISLLVVVASCSEKNKPQKAQDSDLRAFPTPDQVEIRQDGLAYLLKSPAPISGLVIKKTNKSGGTSFLAHYQGGKLHGPEIRWHANGNIKRIHDYDHGAKSRHREWFESGSPKIDAMMRDGIAHGRHLRWYPNGQLRFDGGFIENMRWHGHVRDFAEDGSVLVDAHFDQGAFVSGTVPPDFPIGSKKK